MELINAFSNVRLLAFVVLREQETQGKLSALNAFNRDEDNNNNYINNNNQRTNDPVNAHLISVPTISTKISFEKN